MASSTGASARPGSSRETGAIGTPPPRGWRFSVTARLLSALPPPMPSTSRVSVPPISCLPGTRLTESLIGVSGKVALLEPRTTKGGSRASSFSVMGRLWQPGSELARYTTAGRLDAGFGSGGRVRTPEIDPAGGFGVAIQDDGRIVVAGGSGKGKDPNYSSLDNFVVARYLPDGRLDRGFGSGGTVVTRLRGGGTSAVAIQRDGRIVAIGGAGKIVSSFGLARYTGDGRLDSSFGSGGKVISDFPGHSDVADAVAIQGDGRIVVLARINLGQQRQDQHHSCSLHRGGESRPRVRHRRERHHEASCLSHLPQRSRDSARRQDCRRRKSGR